jgi:hypothetical protein
MISENLKNRLLERAKDSELNFYSLISFLEHSEYEFIGSDMIEALGIATYKKAYFNLEKMMEYDDQFIFFTILHEYAHILSIEKVGLNSLIDELKEKDIKVFASNFIREEILADRFGQFWFYVMNKKLFPHYRTQQLELESNQDYYEYSVNSLLGKIYDFDTYYDNLYQFITDWRPIDVYAPEWYKDVALLTKDGKIRENFHRLQGDDEIYYGTLDSNELVLEEDVSHWKALNDTKFRIIKR